MKKLLIVTQAVDMDDPILGFFHGWLAFFAEHCDQVTVIAQRTGRHLLPANVRVLSLGKEEGKSKTSQIVRFWKLIIKHRADAVLVHMTPIWIVLGMPVWFWKQTKLYLWYEARGGGWPLKIAALCVRKIFSASKGGLPFESSKQVVTGHGINTKIFRPSGPRDPSLVVSVGRITKAKNLEAVLQAFAALPLQCHLQLVGSPVTEADQAEWAALQKYARELDIQDRMTTAALPQDQTLSVLQRASLFLHASRTGLDKAPLEAMACGCVVISSASLLQAELPPQCRADDETFLDVTCAVYNMPEAKRANLASEQRARIELHHALPTLIEKLVYTMSHEPSHS